MISIVIQVTLALASILLALQNRKLKSENDYLAFILQQISQDKCQVVAVKLPEGEE